MGDGMKPKEILDSKGTNVRFDIALRLANELEIDVKEICSASPFSGAITEEEIYPTLSNRLNGAIDGNWVKTYLITLIFVFPCAKAIKNEDFIMRLSEYLEVGKKMKTARTNADISQRDMAIKLALSNSSYSNYENGYSEPPAEIIVKFCDVLNITMENLLELKVAASKTAIVRTFADLLSILIDLDRRGLSIKGNTTYSQQDNQLMAHFIVGY